jgi:hypothetical protein
MPLPNYNEIGDSNIKSPDLLNDGEEISVKKDSLKDEVKEETGRSDDNTRETTDFCQENVELGAPTSLREEMLEELERLRRIMNGGENELDEQFLNHLTAKEKEILDNFVDFFSTCPICNQENHTFYLKRFYFSTNAELMRLKECLLELMKDSIEYDGNYYNKIVIGIPCCDCFKQIFGSFREYP